MAFIPCPARGQLSVSWLTQYGSSDSDFGQGIVVDATGQSWVTGSATRHFDNTPIQSGGEISFLSRISATGQVLYTRERETIYPGSTGANAVALFGASTVFTGGYANNTLDSQASAGGADAALLNYDTSGVWQGTKLFGSAGNENIMALAANGTNLFSAGWTTGSFGSQTNAGNQDAFLSKHDASGNVLWTRFLGSNNEDQALTLALDTTGNAYIAGYTLGNLPGSTLAGPSDLFLAKYDTNGNRTLLKQFGTGATDGVNAMKVDAAGNIYLGGYTTGNLDGQTNAGNGTTGDAFLTKLDNAGNTLWTRLFGGSEGEEVNALDLDSAGHVWIGGNSSSTFAGHTNLESTADAYVAAYDTNGNLLATTFLATIKSDYILGLDAGPDGVYITGRTDGVLGASNAGTGSDIFVAKITGVPEPGCTALVLIGASIIGMHRRRKMILEV